ncbi:MAG: hypothetical protein AAF196_03045 [Planctomycetota bacterium]
MTDFDALRRHAAKMIATRGVSLPDSAWRVLDVLEFHATPDLLAWPASRTIAELVGIDRRSVRRALDLLVERQVIEVHRPGARRRSTSYRLFAGAPKEAVEQLVHTRRLGAPTAPKTEDMGAPVAPKVENGAPKAAVMGAPAAPISSERPTEVVGAPDPSYGRTWVRPEPTEPISSPQPPSSFEEEEEGSLDPGPESEPEPDEVPWWFQERLRAAGVGLGADRLWPAFESDGGTELELDAIVGAAGKPAFVVHWIRQGRAFWEGRIPEPAKPRSSASTDLESWLVECGVEHSNLGSLADGFAASGGAVSDLEVLDRARRRAGFPVGDLVTWIRSEHSWRQLVQEELQAGAEAPSAPQGGAVTASSVDPLKWEPSVQTPFDLALKEAACQ